MDLLPDLARHRGDSDWPKVPQNSFLFLFEMELTLFQSAGTSLELPQLLTYDRLQHNNFFCQFPPGPQMHLTRSHGPVHISGSLHGLSFDLLLQWAVLHSLVSAFGFYE